MTVGLNRRRKGYLRLRISGGGLERFLNLCCANGVEPWDLHACGGGTAECSMELPQFRRIRPFARKAGVKVRIVGRYGLPFFIYRNRKREGAVCGILLCGFLLYTLSLFIWNITFEGNCRYSRDTLLDYLETLDIRYGMRRDRIRCEDLEESIRSMFPEITWVSAGVTGTRLVVRIKENEVLSSVPVRDESPCELAASEPGTITRMIVRQGRACVSVGDTVEEGQLLVSSGLAVTNDAGGTVRVKYVHADADIYARTDFVKRIEMPKMRRQEVPTGRVRRSFTVSAGAFRAGLHLPARGELTEAVRRGALEFAGWLAEKTGLGGFPRLPASESGDTLWKETTGIRQLRLFGDFYLPVYLEETTAAEYTFYDRPYTQEEISAAARYEETKYIENLCEKGVHIIENNVKIQEYGVSLTIECTVTGEQEITLARAVQIPDTRDEELTGQE